MRPNQGFWIQFLGLIDILWTDAIAFHIYALIVLNFTFKKAEKMFKYYVRSSPKIHRVQVHT